MAQVFDPNRKISADKDVPSAHSVASELTPEELITLRSAIKSLMSPGLKGVHIEIGTAAEGTLGEMLKVSEGATRPPFWVVDTMTYFHHQLETVNRNLHKHGLTGEGIRCWTMMRGRAFAEASKQPPQAVFLFIDADPELHGVTRDLQWTHFLVPGGWLAMHDHMPGSRLNGVTLAADRFRRRNPQFEKRSLTGSLLILRKRGAVEHREFSLIEVYRAEVLHQFIKLRRSLTKRRCRFTGRGFEL